MGGRGTRWSVVVDVELRQERVLCVSVLGRQVGLLSPQVLSTPGPVCWGIRAWLCLGSHGDGSAVQGRGAEARAAWWPWTQGPGSPMGHAGQAEGGSQVSEALRGEQGGWPWAQGEPAF